MKLIHSRAFAVCLASIGLIAATMLTSCGGDFFSENVVTDVTVDPSSIPRRNTGMTDQYFTIEVSYRGFESDVSDVEVFIQNPTPNMAERAATIRGGSMQMFPEESRIVFETAQDWFSGVEPGTYSIGASISGSSQDGLDISSTRRDLAEVTITE